MEKVDLVIVGAGIVGMAIADRLKQRSPGLDIAILDKESDVAQHASGRNSGVLHAGFYYTADSLKARLTVAGNTAMREFCQAQGIGINECGKLVVATNRAELKQLKTLEARGQANGSAVSIISAAEAERIEPNVRTYEQALWSPRTATVDPKEVCLALKGKLLADDMLTLVTPYLSGSIGVGFNRSHHFTISPKLFNEVPAPEFNSHTKTAFSYTLGTGIQKALNEYWQVGIGYEFADWGKSNLSAAYGQSINSGLQLNHLYTNQLQFSVSYTA